jgi:hypothetical protein
MSVLTPRGTSQFFADLGDDRLATYELKDASVRFDLARRTITLTGVAVRLFERLGRAGARKGHRCPVLSLQRHEYISREVVAFQSTGWGGRSPVTVCELEHAANADLAAYSIWKLGAVRAAHLVLLPSRVGRRLRVCRGTGRPRGECDARHRVRGAGRGDVSGRGLAQRCWHAPYGFFLQSLKANSKTGRFERFVRQ